MGVFDVILNGSKKEVAKTLSQLQNSLKNELNVTRDTDGKINATVKEGVTLEKGSAAETFLNATTDKGVTVKLDATKENIYKDTKIIGDLFNGNKIKSDGKVETSQIINPNQTEIIDTTTGRESGVSVSALHGVLESFTAGKTTEETGVPAQAITVTGDEENPEFTAAHNSANSIDRRHLDNYYPFSPKGSNEQYIVPTSGPKKGIMQSLFKL